MATEQYNLAAVTSLYQTINTVYVCGNPTWELALPADPRRIYLRVISASTPALATALLPGPIDPSLTPGTVTEINWEYKYKDCPSVVSGEFYYFGSPGDTIYFVQCLKVG